MYESNEGCALINTASDGDNSHEGRHPQVYAKKGISIVVLPRISFYFNLVLRLSLKSAATLNRA